MPTDKYVLFGHHFAAIAGAGPLVGPVLAAQMGYLPGTLWILAGAILAGAVQDFVILFMSTLALMRALKDMIRSEIGSAAGWVAMVGTLAIMLILLAVLALIVVKALAQSPWGTFTVMATLPIAVFMGVCLRFLRPGRVLEVPRHRRRAAAAGRSPGWAAWWRPIRTGPKSSPSAACNWPGC